MVGKVEVSSLRLKILYRMRNGPTREFYRNIRTRERKLLGAASETHIDAS